MASEVDICNLALGHLGDDATVSSINPPEGSIQAEHCARFYPIARDVTLEAHDWGFATVRADLALLSDTPPPGWAYAYQAPNNCRNIIKLIDPNWPALNPVPQRAFDWQMVMTVEPEVPYELEARSSDGVPVIYTNLESAQIQYVRNTTDTTKFSAQFVDAVSWLLASYLAGPVIKGDAGAQMAQTCTKAYMLSVGAAKATDANNRRRAQSQGNARTDWIVNR
ncbi:hypothetical protein ABLT15_28135 [Paraburkholderia tropica]|uniref:hypothetical protein n=1 Tax=Paraburkholderia tropica TaxID=92647 RepID=UPI0032B31BBF